jgi:hypothetical protein
MASKACYVDNGVALCTREQSQVANDWRRSDRAPNTYGIIALERLTRGWRRTIAHMMLTQDSKLDLQGRIHRLNRLTRVYRRRLARNGRTWLFSSWGKLTALLAAANGLMLTMNPAWRHWAGHMLANIFILGGIVAAPLVSMVGWIGVALPAHNGLHEVAPTLFLGALIWLVAAIVAAHANSRRNSDV